MIAFGLFTPPIDAVLVLTAIEFLFRRARTDWLINVQAWFLILFASVTMGSMFTISFLPTLLDGAQLPFWLGFVIFLFVSDLGEYLFHRAQHRIPLLWAMHSLHHSDPEMSALTTQRHFWADPLLKAITIYPVTLMIIKPTPAIIGVILTVALWNFLTHSRLRVDLGRWSWLINTPAYHRRHHSSLPEHYDSNFAALFPIFDVIAGSYRRPDGFPPTGLDHRPTNLQHLATWPLHFANASAEQAAEPTPQTALG